MVAKVPNPKPETLQAVMGRKMTANGWRHKDTTCPVCVKQGRCDPTAQEEEPVEDTKIVKQHKMDADPEYIRLLVEALGGDTKAAAAKIGLAPGTVASTLKRGSTGGRVGSGVRPAYDLAAKAVLDELTKGQEPEVSEPSGHQPTAAARSLDDVRKYVREFYEGLSVLSTTPQEIAALDLTLRDFIKGDN